MVKIIQETKKQLPSYPSLTDSVTLRKPLKKEVWENPHKETNSKIIQEMRLSNNRSASMTNVLSNRSHAMISAGESVILAERLSKHQIEDSSNKYQNIFELTSPRQEGPSLISVASGSFLPSLGLRTSGGFKAKLQAFNEFKKTRNYEREAANEILKDVALLDRKKSALLIQNSESIFDKLDTRMGKKHKKIKINSSMQQPLFSFDQTALDDEKKASDQGTSLPFPSGILAFSRIFDPSTGTFVWEECRILAKVAPGKYAIKWLLNNKPKVVDRLNLRYQEEMEAQQRENLDDRLDQARALQYESLYNSNLKGMRDLPRNNCQLRCWGEQGGCA